MSSGAREGSAPAESYALVFRSNPSPMWVYEAGTLAFLDVNDAASAVYGYSHDEFLTMSVTDLQAPADSGVAAGGSGAQSWASNERRQVTKDGRVLDVEVFSYPLVHSGRATQLEVVIETTGRKRAELTTRQGEERWRKLLAQSNDVLSILDAVGRVCFISSAATPVFGFDPTTYVGAQAIDLLQAEDSEQARRAFRELLEAPPVPRRYEFGVVDAAGNRRWVETTATNMLAEPTVGGIVVHARDVTERRLAEDALRASEARFRSLVQNSQELVLVFDRAGVPSYASPSLAWLSGYDPEELIGASGFAEQGFEFLRDFIHPEDFEVVLSAFDQAVGGTETTIEYRARHRDGGWRWIEATSSSMLDDPHVQGVVVHARDITERKHAELALRTSEERWRRLLGHSSDIVTVIGTDGSIANCSPGAHLFGFETESIPGSSMLDWVEPNDADRITNFFADVLATPGVSPPLELRIRDAWGRFRWVEAVANNLVEDPVVGAVVVHTRDVTDRKEAEMALRQSEERHRVLVEHSSDVVSIVAADGSVRYVSPAAERILGYRAPAAQSGVQFFREFVHPDDLEKVTGALEAAMGKPGVSGLVTYRFRHADGSWRHLESICNNRLGDPTVGGILIVTRDITDRERSRRQGVADEIIGDLMTEPLTEQQISRAAEAGLSQGEVYLAIVVGHTEERPLGDTVHARVADHLDELPAAQCLWARFGGLGILVAPVRDAEDAVLHSVSTEIARLLDAAGPPRGTIVAVGARHPGLSGIKASVDGARRILEVARKAGQRGVVTARDLAVPALLASAPDVASELEAMLRPLVEEDERGHGDLVTTLRMYLNEDMSVHKTAMRLSVHRNTVRARVRRVEALLDLRIAVAKVTLELALAAYELAEPGGDAPLTPARQTPGVPTPHRCY